MKDPLHAEATAYEVLGVTPGATAAEIDAAFKAALMRRGNVNRLNAAKRTLLDAQERTLLDALHYDEAVFGRLTPDPRSDPAALAGERREATAKAWERALAQGFPDAAIAHALGILSYHSAVECEREGRDRESAIEAWQRAVAGWGAALADGVPSLGSGEQRTANADRFAERLRQRIGDAAQARRERGEDVAGYVELERSVAAELKAAREMARGGVRMHGRLVAAGPMLLKRVGAIEAVRAALEQARGKGPASAAAEKLLGALSPVAGVEELLAAGNPGAALEALQKLTPADAPAPRLAALAARARLELGKQKQSLSQFDEALAEFAHALESAPDAVTQGQVRAAIAAACQTRAGSLQATDVGAAIAVLERGLKLVKDDAKLKATLGELLTQRAVQTANEAQRKLGASPDEKAVQGVKKALGAAKKDLDRAVGLGSPRAKENLDAVSNMLAGLESGLIGLPAAVAGPLQRAQELANAGRLDAAIDAAREAKNAAHGAAIKGVSKLLAQLLNARGVQKLSHAMESARPARKVDPKQAVIDFLLDKPVEDDDPFGLGSLGLGGKPSKPPLGDRIGAWFKENWLWVAWPILIAIGAALENSNPQLKGIGGFCVALPWLLMLGWQAIEWFNKTMLASMPPIYGGGRQTSTCMVKGCSSDARYELTPPGFDAPVQLCSSHADGLQKRLSGAPTLNSAGLVAVMQANRDIAEAAQLDPSDTTYSKNLAQAQQVAQAVARG